MADPDAFVALYERDAEAVLVFLTRRTLDVEVALDLTAELDVYDRPSPAGALFSPRTR